MVERPWKQLHVLLLLGVALLIAHQQPIAVQHFKRATECNTSITTTQMVILAITAIHDEASTIVLRASRGLSTFRPWSVVKLDAIA